MDRRHHQALQVPGRGAKLEQAAPSGHGGLADHGQRPHEGAVLGGKADGHRVAAQLHRAVELQQGQVAVVGRVVIVVVEDNFEDAPLLLGFLTHL